MYRQEIHCVLYVMKTIFWTYARSLWKRPSRKGPNSLPTINLCYGCYQHMASNNIQQEYILMSRKFLKKNTESKDCTKDIVKCASVKRKIDSEVISMCVVPA